MLWDWHIFQYRAEIPWPQMPDAQMDWVWGLYSVENWLNSNVGPRYTNWAFEPTDQIYNIGVAFRWERDQVLFVLKWTQ